MIHSLALRHHVFTSIRGYRTVHSSPDLPRDTVEILESLAEAIYPAAFDRTVLVATRFATGGFVTARAFRCGSDHAGRPRTCVHSVVTCLDTRPPPLFSPLYMPAGVFLTADDDLGLPTARLAESVPWQSPPLSPGVGLLTGRGGVSALAGACFRALLSTGRSLRVVGDTEECLAIVLPLVALLPPSLRLSLGASFGFATPEVGGLAPPRLVAVRDVDLPHGEDPLGQATTRVDLSRRTIGGDLPRSPYEEYLADLGKRDESKVQGLLLLLDRLAAPTEPTVEQIRSLASGMRLLERSVDEDGRLEPGFDENRVSAIEHLCEAGEAALALDVMDACLVALGTDRVAPIPEALAEARTALAGPDPERARGVLGAVLPRVARALSQDMAARTLPSEDLSGGPQ